MHPLKLRRPFKGIWKEWTWLKADPDQVQSAIYCIKKTFTPAVYDGAMEAMGLWAFLQPICNSLPI